MRRLFALALILLTAPAHADVLNVPSDFPTIQAAIDAAEDGDEIVLAEGVYAVDSPLRVWSINPNVALFDFTIRSTDPNDPSIVAATNIHVTSFTMFNVPVDRLELAGLTITGEGCQELVSIEDALTIRGCVIDGGGGGDQFEVFVGNQSLHLIDTHFTGQLDRFIGSGVAEAVFDGCTFGPRSGSYDFSWFGADELHLRNMSFSDIGQFDEGKVLWPDARPTLVMNNMVFERMWNAMPRSGRVELFDCRFESITSSFDRYLFSSSTGTHTFLAEDCEFIDLTGAVDDRGLGVVAANDVTIRRSRIERCAGSVGVVHALGTNLVLEECDFIDNNANVAAAVEFHGPGTIERCRFIGNFQANEGFDTTCTIFIFRSNGVRQYADPIVIRDCEFRDNGPRNGSNGWQEIEFDLNVHYEGDGSLAIERSLFIGNRGGVLVSPFNGPDVVPFASFLSCQFVGQTRGALGFGNAVFRGCTFADNGNTPGRLWQFLGTAGEVMNCIIDHDFMDGQGSPLLVGTVAVSNSVLPESLPGAIASTALDPLFMRNPSDGGDGWGDDPTTPDIDESLNDDFGDLRLRPASPAIDAGTNDFFMPGDVDLDGNPRLADDPGIPDAGPNGAVDIGAYEFQGASCLADVTQDGFVTPADFNAWILAYNNGSPLADQTRDGRLTPADFNAWIINFNATFAAGCP